MSDDEEIVCKGNVLYNHLVDQGYSDFGTFLPYSSVNKRLSQENGVTNGHNTNDTSLTEDRNDLTDSNIQILLTTHDYQQICTILNSQLLLREDVDLIEAIISTAHVYKTGSVLVYVSATTSSWLSTVLLFKRGVNIYFSFGLPLLITAYSAWKWYKEYCMIYETKLVEAHVGVLQKLCSYVHKLLRYLKETEILSTGQVSIHIGAAMYTPIAEHEIQLHSLSPWKTLPHLRRCLVEALIEIVNILLLACDNIGPISFPLLAEKDLSYVKDTVKNIESLVNSDKFITIKNVQLLNNAYLVIQSEYLKWIALSIYPVICGSSIELRNIVKKQVFNVFTGVQSKLRDISFKLAMQYNIHNIPSDTNKSLCCKSLQRPLKNINYMQIEVHNIFLLMLSVLLRIRSLDDYLDSISDSEENQMTLNKNVTKQLAVLKDDLICAVQCYDTIYSQLVSMKTTISNEHGEEIDNITNNTESKSKATGIVVGKSDFQVNSPDEVFLAVSGMNYEEYANNLDDLGVEKTPQIPKSLLIELSNTLKSIRKDFDDRERLALERQGLKDIESEQNNLSNSEKEDISSSKKGCRPTRFNYKTKIPSFIDSSGSEDESIESERNMFSKALYRKRNLQPPSILDSELPSDNENDVEVLLPSINNSPLASLIAMKSQMWEKTSEEYFSDW